jgi:biopolymer transport protein ExbD
VLRPATAKRRRKKSGRLNLVPILDAVFIFIFFLLASSNFIRMYEVGSDIPTISYEASNEEQDKPKEKLDLVVKVFPDSIQLFSGKNKKKELSVAIDSKGNFNQNMVRSKLIDLKLKFPTEDLVLLEPHRKVNYQVIIRVMDTLRLLKPSDPAIIATNETGDRSPASTLFSDIIFSNLDGSSE